ncbi:hypothetical protein DY000_02056300 [Brassica cretica]|uniref:Uncharacterized protein n=1 Tax=Brassica cretica TaxID=69181 RepID=A0ABQ7A633_BRACR|nr:hypothetical protein DY000_02056300 [Brassica cretica]
MPNVSPNHAGDKPPCPTSSPTLSPESFSKPSLRSHPSRSLTSSSSQTQRQRASIGIITRSHPPRAKSENASK